MSRQGKFVKLRRTRQKILLIVEGSAHKSEQTYFELLARELRSEKAAVDVKVIPGKGEPSKLLSKCLAEKERRSGLIRPLLFGGGCGPTRQASRSAARGCRKSD